MDKKIAAIVFAAVVILSGTKALANPDFEVGDFEVPPPNRVPEAGSLALMVGCATTGLVGLRFYLRKKG